ncbi:MAG: DnaJ domain-containing protein [Woeseiaceae bacterium]|nr:DnaJ domain-containing protein [Woeseiaceae bacterium]
MALDDYYAVLNVSRSASIDDIRMNYRRLMQRDGHHPDLGGDTATAALINKAYAVLSDPAERTAYDTKLDILRFIAARQPAESAEPEPVRPDPARECVFCRTPHDSASARDPDASCSTCGSPLAVVEQTRMESGDNRGLVRIPKHLPVRFFVDWRQQDGHGAHTEDLSLTGVRLVTRYAVKPGQRIRVASEVVDAVGYVVHSAPRRAGFRMEHVAGVAFVTLRLLQTAGGFVSARI